MHIPRSPLLELPLEIREQIYRCLLNPQANRRKLPEQYSRYDYSRTLVLYRLNRQIYQEAQKIFRSLNTFILVETPWLEAQHHVAVDGRVPILATGQQAAGFKQHTMTAAITAPHYPYSPEDVRQFVILLDDLDAFCNMWRYSDLSHPGLNNHLMLELRFQDPQIRAEWEEPLIPRNIQAALLQPFGMIKNLGDLQVTGTPAPYQSLVKDLRAAMLVPSESPESCLRNATKFKDEGNVALQAARYTEALDLYSQAWLAMHIIVLGRSRQIHADAYFNKLLDEAPFEGQSGHTVRLTLRVKLVANTVLAYLKMEEPQVGHIWANSHHYQASLSCALFSSSHVPL